MTILQTILTILLVISPVIIIICYWYIDESKIRKVILSFFISFVSILLFLVWIKICVKSIEYLFLIVP